MLKKRDLAQAPDTVKLLLLDLTRHLLQVAAMLAQSSRQALRSARPMLLSARRPQSTAAAATGNYENILVDTVGANKDVSLITLNRPKAVRIALASLQTHMSDSSPLGPAAGTAQCPQLPAFPRAQ